eukprot:g2936.t1
MNLHMGRSSGAKREQTLSDRWRLGFSETQAPLPFRDQLASAIKERVKGGKPLKLKMEAQVDGSKYIKTPKTPPSQQTSPQLPMHWVKQLSKSKGVYYYYNTMTGASTFHRPFEKKSFTFESSEIIEKNRKRRVKNHATIQRREPIEYNTDKKAVNKRVHTLQNGKMRTPEPPPPPSLPSPPSPASTLSQQSQTPVEKEISKLSKYPPLLGTSNSPTVMLRKSIKNNDIVDTARSSASRNMTYSPSQSQTRDSLGLGDKFAQLALDSISPSARERAFLERLEGGATRVYIGDQWLNPVDPPHWDKASNTLVHKWIRCEFIRAPNRGGFRMNDSDGGFMLSAVLDKEAECFYISQYEDFPDKYDRKYYDESAPLHCCVLRKTKNVNSGTFTLYSRGCEMCDFALSKFNCGVAQKFSKNPFDRQLLAIIQHSFVKIDVSSSTKPGEDENYVEMREMNISIPNVDPITLKRICWCPRKPRPTLNKLQETIVQTRRPVFLENLGIVLQFYNKRIQAPSVKNIICEVVMKEEKKNEYNQQFLALYEKRESNLNDERVSQSTTTSPSSSSSFSTSSSSSSTLTSDDESSDCLSSTDSCSPENYKRRRMKGQKRKKRREKIEMKKKTTKLKLEIRKLESRKKELKKFENVRKQKSDKVQQLTRPQSGPDLACFQFGRKDKKLGPHHFVLDFRFPLAPVQAFAMALSQFDFNAKKNVEKKEGTKKTWSFAQSTGFFLGI